MALLFSKEEKICYKMVYYIYVSIKPVVRNRIGKLEFTQMKN